MSSPELTRRRPSAPPGAGPARRSGPPRRGLALAALDAPTPAFEGWLSGHLAPGLRRCVRPVALFRHTWEVPAEREDSRRLVWAGDPAEALEELGKSHLVTIFSARLRGPVVRWSLRQAREPALVVPSSPRLELPPRVRLVLRRPEDAELLAPWTEALAPDLTLELEGRAATLGGSLERALACLGQRGAVELARPGTRPTLSLEVRRGGWLQRWLSGPQESALRGDLTPRLFVPARAG